MVAGVNHQPNLGFQNIQLTNEETSLLNKMKAFSKGGFLNKGGDLKKVLPKATPIQLSNILQVYCADLINDADAKDPLAVLDRIGDVLPLDKVQEAVKDDFGNALTEAKNMFEEAKLYLQMNEQNVPKAKRSKIHAVLDKVIKVLESFIAAIGIGDFFKSADNQMQGEDKSHKIMMLISLFTMISTLLIPVLGPAVAGLIVGGIFLTIAVLSLIWPYIKPMPTHLPADAKNLTMAVQKGDFVAQGRKEALDEIANIMKMGRHAMLLGPPRVGKSSTAEAFAEAVARGDYPELKGKVVFRINTPDLLNQHPSYRGGGNPILKDISQAMGRHRNNIILVLDEIHAACHGNEMMGDRLKPFLDNRGDFPHVIGITTKDEYERDILGIGDLNKKNPAFANRFDIVKIQNTDEVETLKVLGDFVLKSPAKPILEEGVLKNIFDQTNALQEEPQPATAVRILNRCIVKTERLEKTATEQKITKVANQVDALRAQGAASRGKNRAAKEEIAVLENELGDLQKKAAAEKVELDRLNRSKALFDRVTVSTYSTAIAVSAIAGKKLSDKDESQMKKLILLNQFMAKTLERFMDEKSQALGVSKVIDQAKVNEAIQEYKQELEQKKKKAEEAKVNEKVEAPEEAEEEVEEVL